MTTGFEVLALVAGQVLSYFTEDDILDPNITQFIYFSIGSTVPTNTQLTFIHPRGNMFFVNPPGITTGGSTVSTPKGSFTAGKYVIYPIASDQFSEVGVWQAYLTAGGQASFYVGTLSELIIQAETGETIYTESSSPLYIEVS